MVCEIRFEFISVGGFMIEGVILELLKVEIVVYKFVDEGFFV